MLVSKQLFLKYVPEITPENLQLEPLKYICSSSSLLIHLLLQNFVNKFLKKNISEDILGKIDKNLLPHLADFGY